MSRRDQAPAALFEAALGGDRASTARLLSLIERGGPAAREVGRIAHAHSGEAYTVGLTGAPGAGKSTLTSALITHLRSLDLEVAVLAIDPSSPFTGGAILGDRVRMQEHATDPGVFIRSMATRGHLGGLSLATPEAVRLLDAIGRRWILVETVGVGQVEVEIAGKADTTVVVVNPGWGDSVQANKAGLMEIADVFVINKADRNGVDDDPPRSRADARPVRSAPRRVAAPDRAHRGDHRRGGRRACGTPIVRHREHVDPERAAGRAARRSAPARSSARSSPSGCARRPATMCTGDRWDELSGSVVAHTVDPWTAADEMLAPVDA